ncbi:MAG TPA: protein-disulfide reductase DsbD domain-containing protein [Rickettsiales bacterium]|nr:protein-disulfide reductase DsbD domain-containing protein [Rickettsiales bacterium]
MQMVRNIILVALFALALLHEPCRAEPPASHTEGALVSSADTIHAGQKFTVALHLKMQPGWHTYWKNPGDSGMAPELNWTLPKGFTAGEPQFPAPTRMEEAGMVDYGYNDEAWLLVPMTAPQILSANTIAIFMLKARWLVCKDVCIPDSGSFSLSLPETPVMEDVPGKDAQIIADVARTIPVPYEGEPLQYSVQDKQVHIRVPLQGTETGAVDSAQFLPETQGFIPNNAPQQVDIAGGAVSFSIAAEKGTLPEDVRGLVSLVMKNGEHKNIAISFKRGAAAPVVHNTDGVLSAVLFALLGGLILNLMPCVFPILALKALAVAKKAEKNATQVRLHGLAYTAGVILSFLALAGILIAVRESGRAIGWGYQMQSPVFVFVLAIVFFLVGLNLSGFFELPSLFGNVGGYAAGKQSLTGSFITGVLAVMVATPCTAPFMATAVGFAFTQPLPVIMTIFTGMGAGLAMPFLLLSLFPRLATLLPKPGLWMLTFRQATAFPMYLGALWLLWVLGREAGLSAVFMALLINVFLTFALWLGKLEARFTTLLGLLVGIASLLLVIGFAQVSTSGGKPKTEVEKFSPAHLAELRGEGKAVFVDATADWCITCKVNESVALSSRKVQEAFAKRQIVYMVADWTNGDKDITSYLQSFGRAGVPIYVYYPAGGKEPVVLPQVLTESTVIEAIK